MRRIIAINTIVVMVSLALANPTLAIDRSWDSGGGANNNWSYPLNWSGDTEPLGGDNAYIGNGGTAVITNSGETCRYLYMGNSGGTNGNVVMNSGALNATVHEWVGNSGTATFTQNDGSNTSANSVDLGRAVGGHGTYNLYGGSLEAGYEENIGRGGTGVFNQTGGTNTVDYTICLGLGDNASGTYNLSGTGQMTTENLYLGKSGQGVFTQTGGTATVTNRLYMGYYPDSTGEYNLTNAQLNVDTLYVGGDGTGTFTQIGGTTTVDFLLYICEDDTSTGTYTLKGGTINHGPNGAGMTVRSAYYDTASATFQGWGTVDLSWSLVNNGRIIANGYGADHTLDMTDIDLGVTSYYDNTTDDGWFAVNHGKLELPAISVSAGNNTYNWGENSTDTTIDLVNSVRAAFSGIGSAGDWSVDLLATDRNDVPGLPDSAIGLWDLSGNFTFNSVNLTFRYDDALADLLALNEADLQLFHYTGGQWVDVTTGIDTANNWIYANNVDSLSYFAVMPEPVTVLLLVLGGITLMIRKRK